MEEKPVLARLIMQQCIHAKLQTKLETDTGPAEYVEIKRGVVAYICFMKDATENIVKKIVNTLTTVKLSRNDNDQLVSILDLPGSILIVPQATLGGKLKGKRMQYHGNIEKAKGLLLYQQFVNDCQQILQKLDKDVTVKYGTYGNLQVLDVNTNGPYTHVMDFN